MNKALIFLSCIVVMLITSCSQNSHIPDISILDEIPSSELSDVLDYENKHDVKGFTFEEMYPQIRRVVDKMSEIQKAKFAKLTYRELYTTQCAVDDTTKRAALKKEWQKKYDELLPKAKAKTYEMTQEIQTGFRLYAYRYGSGGYSAFQNYLRHYGYAPYLKMGIYDPWKITEDSWNYPGIIKKYIDPEFESEDFWVTEQRLNELKSKHPLAVEFLEDRHTESKKAIEDLLNLF